MLFLADDEELLEKFIKVWNKIEDLIGKKFNSDVILGNNNDDADNDNKYIKTKIKSFLNNIKINFYDENGNEKVPKKVGHISVLH